MFYFIILFFITFLLLCFILRNQLKLTKDMNQLNQKIEQFTAHSSASHQYFEKKLLEEKRAHVLLLTYEVREAVAKQQSVIHASAIEHTPRHHNLSSSELSAVCSAEEAIILHKFWTAYQDYLQTHWLTKDGKIKTVFRGKPEEVETELGFLHHSSKMLVQQFDQWLTQLNSFS
ncbi:hypothetical protein JCM9140_1659 [Halalkalibacter wakoensis JCM 9140]|uniref:Uncharacterized protein n=1 Tax=Halalkalibacter wakoensis JCM 9140 TaxID=1236970 RepID=W4Q0Z7_9BACI|nr:hypothetical protein [Halalkalibacter wakoensis]GAE25652.1 hypothetical protein JCM9140_1659 [Halalkalibacter wakoensis JCM 9140]